ncbi:MAG: putative Ig domain-containing protein [Dehalococcoidia bacterium]
MKKHILRSQGNGRGLYLTVLCLLAIFSAFFLIASPVQAIPVIFPGSLPNGQVGTPYTATLVAASTVGAYTWAVTGGSLPPLLTLNAATGVISGNPTSPGTFTFIVTITDTTGPSSAQGFFITITQPPLRFLTTSLLSAKEGESYSAVITVSGGTTPYTWSISSGSLPSGLTLNAGTGYISGIPDKGSNGNYSFMVQVTDSSATPLSGQQSFSITVEKGGYDATITISSGLKAGQTKVYVSGSTIATLHGGQSTTLSLDLGAIRSVSVDPTVEDPTEVGIRYKAQENAITINESSPNANFTYNTEYSIDFKTEPSKVGQLSGSGWYKEDYTLRTSAPDQVNDPNSPGIQYRFAYWKLPTGETVSGRDLSLTVNAAGSCTAYYDTYYRLTLTSPYGEAEGSDWYKAGSEAKWSMNNPQVKIQGILGIFGGKLNAVNSSGTTQMDSPKTVTIDWQPDYTLPFIMIPLTIVLLILGGYGLYLLLRSLQPKPAAPPPPYYPYMPPPPPPQPLQPPQTTVVMIGGDKPKLGPATTREQLMEKFGELLQKYEDEIKVTTGAKELPGAPMVGADKRLSAPQSIPPAAAEAATPPEEETTTCNFTSKRALRVVASNWRQVETRTAKLPTGGKKTAEDMPGIAIMWARDIFQEWEILSCWLPRGHKEPHEGSVEIVYSRMNTVNEEQIYAPGQELEPPAPHYTDGMPQVDIAAREVVAPEKLPPETAS